MIQYKIILSFDLGKAVDKIGDLEKSVNDTLSNCGVGERFSIRSKGLSMSLNCNRELKRNEVRVFKDLILKEFNNKFSWNFKIESFRRKSGKSCSKSESR